MWRWSLLTKLTGRASPEAVEVSGSNTGSRMSCEFCDWTMVVWGQGIRLTSEAHIKKLQLCFKLFHRLPSSVR